MPTLERKGHIIQPEFENGRIVVRNLEHSNKTISTLTVMKRPMDEEAENYHVFKYGYMNAYDRGLLGHIDLTKFTKSAKFIIYVHVSERSKGYGTVLMNAGAKNCRDSGIPILKGTFLLSDDWERRMEFYEKLNMPVRLYKKTQLETHIDNPSLNTIKFEDDAKASDILNSIPALQFS